MSGRTVKMLTYATWPTTCPWCDAHQAQTEVVLVHRGGSVYRAVCPECGLTMQVDALLQARKGEKA